MMRRVIWSRDVIFFFCLVPGKMSFKFNFGGKESDPSANAAEIAKSNHERKRAAGKEHFMEETHLVCTPYRCPYEIILSILYVRNTSGRMRCFWRTPSWV